MDIMVCVPCCSAVLALNLPICKTSNIISRNYSLPSSDGVVANITNADSKEKEKKHDHQAAPNSLPQKLLHLGVGIVNDRTILPYLVPSDALVACREGHHVQARFLLLGTLKFPRVETFADGSLDVSESDRSA